MERRFVLFLVLALFVWTSFFALRLQFAPPRPQVAEQAEKGELPPAPADQKKPAERDKIAGQPPPDEKAAPPVIADAAALVPATPAAPRQRGTIGSLDSHSMLVTWDSRGAVVERVELSAYKSVDDESGYLGHLGFSDGNQGGVEVHLIGPGTPAARAQAGGQKPGLLRGDIIQQIDGQQLTDATALEAYISKKTRPGQTVTLAVQRSGVQQPLQFTTTLTRRPLELLRPESHVYKTPAGMQLLPEDPLSFLLTLENVGGRGLRGAEAELPGLPSLHKLNWTVEQQGPDFVEFSFLLDEAALSKIGKQGSLKVIKRYSLAKPAGASDPAYHLDLRISIQNQGPENQTVAYRLGGPTGLPLEGWWYSNKLHPKMFHGAGARDVVFDQPAVGHRLLGCPDIVSDAKSAKADNRPAQTRLLVGDQAAPLNYIGVDTQFFASVLQPLPVGDQPIKFFEAVALPVQDVSAIPKTQIRTANVSFRVTTDPHTEIKAGETLTHDYRVFLGPKKSDLLHQYGLSRVIEYGWRIFGGPAKLLLSVLGGLYWLTSLIGIPNYGIAIILLTVIVRTCMIPVSLKQARAAAKMQELAPEIQKIKAKHPDDPMKQHAAVQELYKKHNFNMFSGCLPVFIQLPIFIGLYRCLSIDIDLRDASLIPGLSWASNLAGPDKLFYWENWLPAFIGDEADGWLGPYFNVFPLITVALFLVQQKMFTPPATDEQTRMQQQMMTYMTIFMGVMFYKVPAGLCLYFITSSLWGICERKLLPKVQPKDAAGLAGGGKDSGGGKDGGGGILSMLPTKPTTPNGSTRPPSRRQRQKK